MSYQLSAQEIGLRFRDMYGNNIGLDATIPWVSPDGEPSSDEEKMSFSRVSYQPVDLGKYV